MCKGSIETEQEGMCRNGSLVFVGGVRDVLDSELKLPAPFYRKFTQRVDTKDFPL